MKWSKPLRLRSRTRLGILAGAFLLSACSDAATPSGNFSGVPASIQAATDSNITLIVAVGDSLIFAGPGNGPVTGYGYRSRCVRWDALRPNQVVRIWVHTRWGGETVGRYEWKVQPPRVDMWVSGQQWGDSSGAAMVQYVSRTCGDTALLGVQ